MRTTTESPTVTERLADWSTSVPSRPLNSDVATMVQRVMLDTAGLCVAVRRADYVAATLMAAESGSCTVIGYPDACDMYGAALVNGTAAHGEDFDDTFEGGPVHSGAVIVPAVLASCERYGRSGADALAGLAVGIETLCRLSLVAPQAIHKAGFHPTAVLGTIAATAGVGTALGLNRRQMVSALGIAGSMASGIIEYLADGSWTKRMHAGWSAQSGIRAALLAQGGFIGPVSVLEGTHGFFKAFAPSCEPDFDALLDGLGTYWHLPTIAFKPYACGTMTQPYVDCAVDLRARGVQPEDIKEIVCEVGEGTVHRLWEPLAGKQAPPSPYFAKFSTPYCIAVGFFDGAAGLAQFTEERISDPAVRDLAGKVSYVVDPENPYPKRFTGHIRVRLRDGNVIEIRRDNMRGGSHDPLSQDELERKFFDNAMHGGWSREKAERMKSFCFDLDRRATLSDAGQFLS
jgi:2-methylcitrate dehydratase PrpD